jgi:hypothetical protein
MGLIKKKDRSEKRGSQAGGRTQPPMAPGKPAEGDAPQGGTAADTPEPSFPTELRLAVEAVAASDGAPAGGGGSDAYGLRAELQASRRRGDENPDEPVAGAVESNLGAVALAADAQAPVTPEASAEEAPEAVSEAPEPEAAEPEVAEPESGDAVAGEAETTPDEPDTREDEPAAAHESDEAEPAAAAAAEKSDAEVAATAGTFAAEARARLEALERSIVEKTETLRERAAELADREGALARTGDELDQIESRFAERQRELEEREEALRAEAERLEQEQAIWGEATRESRTKLTELQETVDAKEKELADLEAAHAARAAELDRLGAELDTRATELDRLGAELDARADRISVAEDEHAARMKELDDREAQIRVSEEALADRERRLSERDTAIAGREAALDQSEARVAEREESFEQREAELVAREEALTADREQLDRDRADWDEIMGGAFSRLSELETDLVSSLSLAGMLKRELEGREATERRDRKSPSPVPSRRDPEERRSSRGPGTATEPEPAEPVLAALESNGSSIPKGESGAEQQAAETDWWARQLGRRKKDVA